MTLEQYKKWIVCRLKGNYTVHFKCPTVLKDATILELWEEFKSDDISYLLDLYIEHCAIHYEYTRNGIRKYHYTFDTDINDDSVTVCDLTESVRIYKKEGFSEWKSFMKCTFGIKFDDDKDFFKPSIF